MERLFSPCTRLRDTLQDQGRLPHLGLREGDLDVSTEELLSAERAFTYADLYAMLGNGKTVAWLTPHAAVARADGSVEQSWRHLDESCQFYFNVDGTVLYCLAWSSEHLFEICDIVLRLSFIQSLYTIGIIVMQHRSTLPV